MAARQEEKGNHRGRLRWGGRKGGGLGRQGLQEHGGPAAMLQFGGEGGQLRGHHPTGTAVDQQHQGGRRQADRELLE